MARRYLGNSCAEDTQLFWSSDSKQFSGHILRKVNTAFLGELLSSESIRVW